MSQFIVAAEDIDEAGGTALLRGAEAHHLVRVTRAGIGAPVRLFDGQARRFEARIAAIDDETVHLEGLAALPANEPGAPVHLVQALIKGERWEWLLEKATELGATRITPLITARTVSRPSAGKAEAKTGRWRKIVLAAAKQCERALVPTVDAPVSSGGFLASLGAPAQTERRLIFLERADAPGTTSQAVPTLLAIGPEGGWSEDEKRDFLAAGFTASGLGERILRAETAALAALAVATRWR